MELHQLRCFIAIVEEGGFNRATSRLHITQPALSYQIKQLEQELGATLFHRRPGEVTTTEAGRVLFQHVQELMKAVNQAELAVRELSEGVVGEIRIGTINSVGVHFLPQVLSNMREKYPRARPTVLYRHSNEIIEELLSNHIDLALVSSPRPDKRMSMKTIVEEQISLVCGRSHRFFGNSSIRPVELKGEQFVSLTSDSPTGKLIREHLIRIGINVTPVVITDNVETVKKMVEIGLGVAFLPDMVTHSEARGKPGISGDLFRIQVGPPLTRRIVLVTWKNFNMSRAVSAFIGELQLYANLWKDGIEHPGN